MKNKNPGNKKSKFSIGSLAGVALALVVTGGIFAWVTINRLTSTSNPTTPIPTKTVEPVNPPVVEQPQQPTPQPQPSPQKTTTPQQQTTAVYWLKVSPTATQLEEVPITAQKSTDKTEALTVAFQDLLAGPQDPSYVTTIPEGTKLLDLKVDNKGVHVNLSQDFTIEGGSAEMIGRLAQVIYTATSYDPKVPVWLSVEGEPLELLGEGHGLMVDQPMTRDLFVQNFQL